MGLAFYLIILSKLYFGLAKNMLPFYVHFLAIIRGGGGGGGGGGGSGTKCRTSRRLSVVLDIFH